MECHKGFDHCSLKSTWSCKYTNSLWLEVAGRGKFLESWPSFHGVFHPFLKSLTWNFMTFLKTKWRSMKIHVVFLSQLGKFDMLFSKKKKVLLPSPYKSCLSEALGSISLKSPFPTAAVLGAACGKHGVHATGAMRGALWTTTTSKYGWAGVMFQ